MADSVADREMVRFINSLYPGKFCADKKKLIKNFKQYFKEDFIHRFGGNFSILGTGIDEFLIIVRKTPETRKKLKRRRRKTIRFFARLEIQKKKNYYGRNRSWNHFKIKFKVCKKKYKNSPVTKNDCEYSREYRRCGITTDGIRCI